MFTQIIINDKEQLNAVLGFKTPPPCLNLGHQYISEPFYVCCTATKVGQPPQFHYDIGFLLTGSMLPRLIRPWFLMHWLISTVNRMNTSTLGFSGLLCLDQSDWNDTCPGVGSPQTAWRCRAKDDIVCQKKQSQVAPPPRTINCQSSGMRGT